MKYLPYILSLFLLSSCSSTFYYSTLNTTNEYVEKVDNGDFLLETDSLWIAYCFKGAGAPMQITIFNKLDEPLYVDWGRSAMIMDSMAFSYAGESVPFYGNSRTSGYNLHSDGTSSYSTSLGEFSGNIQIKSDHTTFIPPQTMISEVPLYLDPNFKNLDKKIYRDANMADRYDEAKKVSRADFSTSDSPLRFKSYLTLYASPDKPMVFEQDFYMSTLVKTGISPNNLAGDIKERGDFFYIEQPANNNALYTTLGIVLAGGFITLGVLYGDWDENDIEYDW